MQIGPHVLANNLVLAPMAGVTDRPFRQLCRKLGAGMVVSEMVTSDTSLWNSRKTRHRLNHDGEVEPRIVQIAGYRLFNEHMFSRFYRLHRNAEMCAARRGNVERGACGYCLFKRPPGNFSLRMLPAHQVHRDARVDQDQELPPA